MDFLMFWFEKHWVLAMVFTTEPTIFYAFWKDYTAWAFLCIFLYLLELIGLKVSSSK